MSDAACMFDDPGVYACLRADVLPLLRTWPSVRVWQLGLVVPEDPWALSILLFEAGLLSRSTIYATDPDVKRVERSRAHELDAERLRAASAGYRAAGGQASLDEYWMTDGNRVAIRASLRERVAFFEHDSCCDTTLNEFQLIVWRAPSDPTCDGRVASVVHASSCRSGVVAFLGRPPAPAFSRSSSYLALAPRVFRRVV